MKRVEITTRVEGDTTECPVHATPALLIMEVFDNNFPEAGALTYYAYCGHCRSNAAMSDVAHELKGNQYEPSISGGAA